MQDPKKYFWVQFKRFTLVSKLYLVGLLIKCQICWHAQKPILLWQLIFATIFYCDKSNFYCLWNSFTIFSVFVKMLTLDIWCSVTSLSSCTSDFWPWDDSSCVVFSLGCIWCTGLVECFALEISVSAIGLWLAGRVIKETFADLVKIFSLTSIAMGKWESDVFVWCYRIVY